MFWSHLVKQIFLTSTSEYELQCTGPSPQDPDFLNTQRKTITTMMLGTAAPQNLVTGQTQRSLHLPFSREDPGSSLTLRISAVMINSVCLPSADLGFGRGVPSPNRILNFSFKPESLLAGLAMLGKDAPEDSSVPRIRQRPQERLCPPAPQRTAGRPRTLGSRCARPFFLPQPPGDLHHSQAVPARNKPMKGPAVRPRLLTQCVR